MRLSDAVHRGHLTGNIEHLSAAFDHPIPDAMCDVHYHNGKNQVPWRAEALVYAGLGGGYAFFGYKMPHGEVRVLAGCRNVSLEDAEMHWDRQSSKSDCVKRIKEWSGGAKIIHISETYLGTSYTHEDVMEFFGPNAGYYFQRWLRDHKARNGPIKR